MTDSIHVTIPAESAPGAPTAPAKDPFAAGRNGLIEADVRRWAIDWAIFMNTKRDTFSIIWLAQALSHFVITGNVPDYPREPTRSDQDQ